MPPASQPTGANPDAVIIGAGIGGLTCASLLARAGLRVLVAESSDVPGGRARSWRDPGTGVTVDIGPHILLNQYANMRGLMARLGTEEKVFWQTDELLTVHDNGRAIHFKVGGLPAPLHYLRNLPRILPSVPLRHLLSNMRVAWRTLRSSAGDIRALDGETGREYLRRMGVNEGFIDWFWTSASMALLNLPVEQCSAAALMRLFAQMMGHNDVAFGIPAVGLSDLYAWPCVADIEQRGGEVRLRCGAVGLDITDDRIDGVVLDDGTRIRAPVVLAVPPTALPSLLPVAHPLAARARNFEPSPYVSCYLWFDRKLTSTPFWARPWSPGTFNTDFYDLANVRPSAPSGGAPSANSSYGAGSMVATNIIWSHRAAHLSDEEIIIATLAEIADFAPAARKARLLARAVHRIPMSVPCARPGMETLRPRVRQEPGLFLASDWVNTGLPFCMESATRAGALAAEAVLAERGRRVALALPAPEPGGLSRLLRRKPWRDGVDA
jgi:15-cis-phytoene desaturase